MTGGTQETDVHLELYVRSAWPRETDAREGVLDAVDGLVDGGTVSSADITVWGDRSPPSPDDARTEIGRFVHNRVAVFREWGRRNDLELGPGFVHRAIDSAMTGRREERIRLPSLAVAAYCGDDLACVAPHVEESGTVVEPRTFLDRLDGEGVDALDYVRVERVGPSSSPSDSPSPAVDAEGSETPAFPGRETPSDASGPGEGVAETTDPE
ncbi:MAG: HTH domain-containing protein [Haloarculaceae archaeon]